MVAFFILSDFALFHFQLKTFNDRSTLLFRQIFEWFRDFQQSHIFFRKTRTVIRASGFHACFNQSINFSLVDLGFLTDTLQYCTDIRYNRRCAICASSWCSGWSFAAIQRHTGQWTRHRNAVQVRDQVVQGLVHEAPAYSIQVAYSTRRAAIHHPNSRIWIKGLVIDPALNISCFKINFKIAFPFDDLLVEIVCTIRIADKMADRLEDTGKTVDPGLAFLWRHTQSSACLFSFDQKLIQAAMNLFIKADRSVGSILREFLRLVRELKEKLRLLFENFDEGSRTFIGDSSALQGHHKVAHCLVDGNGITFGISQSTLEI